MLLAGDITSADVGAHITIPGTIRIRGRLDHITTRPGGMVDLTVDGYDLPIVLWPDQPVHLDPETGRPAQVAAATHDAAAHTLLTSLARKAHA